MNAVSLKNLCCVCLEDGHMKISNNVDLPVPRALESLAMKLESVTSYIAQVNGNYPSMLCKKCITKLNIAFNFIEEFKSSKNKVHNYVDMSDTSIQSVKSEPIDLDSRESLEAGDGAESSNIEVEDISFDIENGDAYSNCNEVNASPQTVLHMSMRAIEETLRLDTEHTQITPPSSSLSANDDSRLSANNAAQKVNCTPNIDVDTISAQTDNLVVRLSRDNNAKVEEDLNTKREALLTNEQNIMAESFENRSVLYDKKEGTLRVQIPLIGNSKKETNSPRKQKVSLVSNGLFQAKKLKTKKKNDYKTSKSKRFTHVKSKSNKNKSVILQDATLNNKSPRSSKENNSKLDAAGKESKTPKGYVTKKSASNKSSSALYKICLKSKSIQSKKRKQDLLRTKINEERFLKMLKVQ